MIGSESGTEHALRAKRKAKSKHWEAGIGLFCNEEGSTTLAAGVAILVSLVLVFSLANIQWSVSHAADVQAVADAGALAGMNMVSAYVTIASILDALVLTLGLVGLLTMAVGLVLCAIPLVSGAGPPVIEAASDIFQARIKLANTAAAGLEKLESVLPYLVAANAYLCVRANATSEGSYYGVALALPLVGSSNFGTLLDESGDPAEELQASAQSLDELSEEAAQDEQKAAEALERAWLADCGGDVSMRERASTLAGLSGILNPTYLSVAGWDFSVAIRRAQAYYSARLAQEAPAYNSVSEQVRSAARTAFYEYALQEVSASSYVENPDGTISCDLHELPSTTAQTRLTSLYTDVRWPCTQNNGVLTIHAYEGCPAATGGVCAYASVAQLEAGEVAVCDTCQFSVVDLGRVASASTSISNGFEYYWKIVVEASRDYENYTNAATAKLEEARSEGETSVSLFQDAIEALTVTRVELCPPGRYGCVCIVADPTSHVAASDLVAFLSGGVELPARAAISAAALAIDTASSGNNILADFFDSLLDLGGFAGLGSSVLDTVFSVWGDMLVAYGTGYEMLQSALLNSFSSLSAWGMGGISSWLKTALNNVVTLSGLQPADLSAKKPVLANSADVLGAAGIDTSLIRSLVSVLDQGSIAQNLLSYLQVLGFDIAISGDVATLTIAEIELPGLGYTIPLTLDVSWLSEAA